MPTFTDASLIAAGAGALLWTLLATDRAVRLRTVIGLFGFVALEAAVLVRYTNVGLLAVAALAALLVFRRAALLRRAVGWWLGSVAGLVAGILVLDQVFYGSALKSGYSPGLVSFSLSSVIPNLRQMPAPQLKSIPMTLLALGALGWMTVRVVRSRRRGSEAGQQGMYRRDALIGAFLAVGWIGIWVCTSPTTGQRGWPGEPVAACTSSGSTWRTRWRAEL